jgi:5'-nucleotidase
LTITPLILVDQDNVLADQCGYFLQLIAREYPEIYRTFSGELISFDFEKNFSPRYADQIMALRRRRGFFLQLELMPGAKNALHALQQQGWEVRIVTAPVRTSYSASEKLDWIVAHLGREWAEKTIITRDKTLVQGDILIDDNPEVRGLILATWRHILYDQSYNRKKNHPRLTWTDDFLSLIKTQLAYKTRPYTVL